MKKLFFIIILILVLVPVSYSKIYTIYPYPTASRFHGNYSAYPSTYRYGYGGSAVGKIIHTNTYGTSGYLFYRGLIPREYRRFKVQTHS